LKSIYYDGFDLVKDEEKGYSLKLQGKVSDYGLLYAQVEAYRKEPKIRQVDVSKMQLDEKTSGVSFELSLLLSPEAMKYISTGTVSSSDITTTP
jgi:hypothetical protein